jgi:hypothetical protein
MGTSYIEKEDILMPLIIRCDSCGKFNLIEDECRGNAVGCLICKESIPRTGTSEIVVVCPRPKCNTKLKIPIRAADQRLQCPKCSCVF